MQPVKKKEAQTETKTETKTETQQETKVLSEIIRKITGKDVLGEITKPEKDIDLYTVLGTIYGYETGKGTYGEFIKFKGDFMAVVKDGGKEFRAPSAILPSPMDMALAGMFDKAVSEMVDENGEIPTGKRASCEMAIVIGIKPATNAYGYEWTMRPLIELQSSNVLDSLKDRVLLLEKDS